MSAKNDAKINRKKYFEILLHYANGIRKVCGHICNENGVKIKKNQWKKYLKQKKYKTHDFLLFKHIA